MSKSQILWLCVVSATLFLSILSVFVYRLCRKPPKKPKTLLEKTQVSFLSLAEETKAANRLRIKKMQETMRLKAMLCHMLMCYVMVEHYLLPKG